MVRWLRLFYFILTYFLMASMPSAFAVTVNCPSGKVQTAIINAPAGVETQIDIQGNCTENLGVPAGKRIILNGLTSNQGAKISPSNLAQPTIYTGGQLTLRNLTVSSSTSTAFAILQADFGGTLIIEASTISSEKTTHSVIGLHNSSIWIKHSNISATGSNQDGAVSIQLSSSLDIQGRDDYLSGPSAKQSIISSRTNAITCFNNSSVHLITKGTSKISVSNSNVGVASTMCNISIINNGTDQSNILFNNNSVSAIKIWNSNLRAINSVFSNTDTAIHLNMSNAVISNSNFTSNTTHVKSTFGSKADFEYWNAPAKTFFYPVNSNSFKCWQDGAIYIDSNGVSQTIGSNGNCPNVQPY